MLLSRTDLLIYFLTLSALIISILLSPVSSLPILLLLIFDTAIFLSFLRLHSRRCGAFTFDIGVFAMSFTYLYSVVPLLNFIFAGFQFGPLSDNRLVYLHITTQQVVAFACNHLVYLISLGISFLIFRNYADTTVSITTRPISTKAKITILACLLSLYAYFEIMRYFFGISIASGYESEAVNSGSLLIQQINGRLSAFVPYVTYTFYGYLLVIAKTSKVNKLYSLLIIFGALSLQLFLFLSNPGSRGEITALMLSILFLSYFLGYISPKQMLVMPLVIVVAFILFGYYRSALTTGSYANFWTVISTGNNEFLSLFATGLDVDLNYKEWGPIPLSVYFNDLLPLLPPQQLLPFTKVTASSWYLTANTNFPFSSGEGYMWSVISASRIGFGHIELALRGLLLGWLCAKIHHWYSKRNHNIFYIVVYLMLCFSTLWAFRDTTGAILWIIINECIPFLLFFRFFTSRADLS